MPKQSPNLTDVQTIKFIHHVKSCFNQIRIILASRTKATIHSNIPLSTKRDCKRCNISSINISTNLFDSAGKNLLIRTILFYVFKNRRKVSYIGRSLSTSKIQKILIVFIFDRLNEVLNAIFLCLMRNRLHRLSFNANLFSRR